MLDGVVIDAPTQPVLEPEHLRTLLAGLLDRSEEAEKRKHRQIALPAAARSRSTMRDRPARIVSDGRGVEAVRHHSAEVAARPWYAHLYLQVLAAIVTGIAGMCDLGAAGRVAAKRDDGGKDGDGAGSMSVIGTSNWRPSAGRGISRWPMGDDR